MLIDQILQQQSIHQFAASAEQFCSLMEHHQDYNAYEFIKRTADSLVTLYKVALSLPDVECDEEKEVVADLDYAPLQLSKTLGKYRSYWEIVNPYHEDEPVMGDLADDLGDLYHELKEGLVIYSADTKDAICWAVWHWRFGFEVHWGDHLVDALRALHRLITQDDFGFRPKQEYLSDDEADGGA